MKKYQQIIGHLNALCFILAIALLPFPKRLAQIACVAWMILWALEFRWTQKSNLQMWQKTLKNGKHLWLPSKSILPILFMALWVIWEAFSLLWGSHIGAGGKWNAAHVSLLCLPLIAFFGLNEYYDWKTIARVYVISSIISVIFYGVVAYLLMNHHWFLDPANRVGKPVFEWRSYQLGSGGLKHRLYYGTQLLIAMVLTLMLRKDFIARRGKTIGYLQICIGLSILLIGILLIDSRASMLTLICLILAAGITHLPKHNRIIVSVVFIILAISAVCATWKLHPRMQRCDIEQVMDAEEHIDDAGFEPRIAIWHYALENPSDYSLYGMGVGNATPYLIEKYQADNLDRYVKRRFGTHNQYLEVWMELGLVALLCFIGIWCFYPFCYKRDSRASRFALFFALTFALNMLTECLMTRIEGVICFVLLSAFTLAINQQEEKEGKQQVVTNNHNEGEDGQKKG